MGSLSISSLLIRVLTAGITIPLWFILAAGLWIHFDKSSAVRAAVHRAVADLVHSAELEAANAQVRALNAMQVELQRQALRDRQALTKFADLLTAAESEKESLYDEIAELEAMPVSDACTVDGALLERLRASR